MKFARLWFSFSHSGLKIVLQHFRISLQFHNGTVSISNKFLASGGNFYAQLSCLYYYLGTYPYNYYISLNFHLASTEYMPLNSHIILPFYFHLWYFLCIELQNLDKYDRCFFSIPTTMCWHNYPLCITLINFISIKGFFLHLKIFFQMHQLHPVINSYQW